MIDNGVYPKISIIVPAYNMQEYIAECVESILNQEFSDYELILVDDGSTDKTGILLDEYAIKDERIKVIHQTNKGLSEARNTGIEIAKGDYISFIDSDDFIHSNMFQFLYNNIIECEADISVCNFHYAYVNNQSLPDIEQNKISVLTKKQAVLSIIKESDVKMIVAWGKLYRKELFLNIRYPIGKYHEDEFVTYKLFYDADKIVVTEAKLYYYRQRNNSITGSRYSLKRLDKLEALKECTEYFDIKGEKVLEKVARYRHLMNIAIAYYRVRTEMKKETKILKWLKEEHREQYLKLQGMENYKERSMEKVIIFIFHCVPLFYCLLVFGFLVISRGNRKGEEY